MAPKRAGEPSSFETAKKMPKLMNEEATNAIGASQIQELRRALDRSDSYYCARYLVQKVAKMTSESSSKVTIPLLEFCIQRDCEDIAGQFLDNENFNLKTLERSELLWSAIEKGRQGIAAKLICSGVDLSVRKYVDNSTLLHEVLRTSKLSRKEELVGLMLDQGADVNARDSDGHSVLHEAIKRDHCSSQLVEELLNHGAQVTINKECSDLDDLRLACKNKPELLPRLVEHQVPDEESRNQRGIIAINSLISERYTGARLAAAMRMVEKILDLGVPVNGVNSFMERFHGVGCSASPLQMALWCKNKETIKLLLERGADPHLIDSFGDTALYQATKFKASTHVSRWLIERGASIHARNIGGLYPIHGACNHESLRNLHLLLNLGADLNVTDDRGQTPFRLLRMSETLKCKEVQHLVIKHFALIVAKGGKIERDMAKICRYEWSALYLEKCKGQLERMKEEKIWKNVSYFSMFTKDMYSMMQLMRNKNFVESFKRDEKNRVDLFSEYSYMLLQCFEIAERRLRMLVAEKNQLYEVFERAMPDHIVENIAYYSCFEKLERCQQDYYMSFHANLKITKTDKAKIL